MVLLDLLIGEFEEIQIYYIYSDSSVAQSCPTLCDPMNRTMPGLPVHAASKKDMYISRMTSRWPPCPAEIHLMISYFTSRNRHKNRWLYYGTVN